jgi:hypothetical protein
VPLASLRSRPHLWRRARQDFPAWPRPNFTKGNQVRTRTKQITDTTEITQLNKLLIEGIKQLLKRKVTDVRK